MAFREDKNDVLDVLIVGGGLSGLIAAQQLQSQNIRVRVLERSLTVGGRLATEPFWGGAADTGAQFFTVRSAAFREVVADWLSKEWVFEWSQGFAMDREEIASHRDGHPRYAATGGFGRLAETLSLGLDVQTGTEVCRTRPSSPGWQLEDTLGRQYRSRSLLLTAPVPVSLTLLQKSDVQLEKSAYLTLSNIAYSPTLCGLIVVDGSVSLPAPGALQRPENMLSWIADNQRKGFSEATVMTLHVNPRLSEKWWTRGDKDVLDTMSKELASFMAADAEIVARRLIRWPHAIPKITHPARMFLVPGLSGLAFAGDAFGGPRVEGAVLSGLGSAAGLLAELGGANIATRRA